MLRWKGFITTASPSLKVQIWQTAPLDNLPLYSHSEIPAKIVRWIGWKRHIYGHRFGTSVAAIKGEALRGKWWIVVMDSDCILLLPVVFSGPLQTASLVLPQVSNWKGLIPNPPLGFGPWICGGDVFTAPSLIYFEKKEQKLYRTLCQQSELLKVA